MAQQRRKILRFAVPVADCHQAREIRWQLHFFIAGFEEQCTFPPEASYEKTQFENDVISRHRFGFTPDVREIIRLGNHDGKVRSIYRSFEALNCIALRLEQYIRPDSDCEAVM